MDKQFIEDFDNLPEDSQKELLKALQVEKIREETKKRLQTDEKIRDYFKHFSASSVEFFTTIYAIKKAMWIRHFESIESGNNYIDFKYTRAAKDLLAVVLKRKAMQKMAEWNAYQCEFDGIETSIDFALWDADIFNVPYIEPIEKDEVDICKKYFLSPEYEEMGAHINLPLTYYSVRNAAAANGDDDADHDFIYLYDTMHGAGTYLLLPPKKTDIEKGYENAYRENNIQQWERDIEEGKIPKPKTDNRPWIQQSYEQFYDFVKNFESSDVIEKFRSYTHFYGDDVKDEERQQLDENLIENLRKMLNETVPIPIEASDDLRTALEKSFEEYEKRQTLKAIDSVYDDYLFRVQNGLAFEKDEKKIAQAEDWIRRTKEYLVKARVFAGKPADLNMF